MDAFPGKTKNSGSKKVLCEINVLDGLDENIILSFQTNGDDTEVKILNKIDGVTYQYKVNAATFDDSATVDIGEDAPDTTAYPQCYFFGSDDQEFDFETSTNKFIKVIGVKGGKVVAISGTTATQFKA